MSEYLVIRADADPRIGSGHIMRSLALAQTCMENGFGVTFISHCESDYIRGRIVAEGIGFSPIEKPWPDKSDLALTMSKLKELRDSAGGKALPWLVLDGYHFTPSYQNSIREAGIHSLVIDDMSHLDRYHANILLNQNPHASQFEYQCDEDTIELLGPEYFLLRHDFYGYRKWVRKIPGEAEKILVTFGGADNQNLTLKVLNALKGLKDKRLEVIAVIGPVNSNAELLRRKCADDFPNTRLLFSVKDMASLLAWADLAVSACGTTSLEMAFMGLPAILFTVAENQAGIGNELHNQSVAYHYGRAEDLQLESLTEEIRSLILDKDRRRTMCENGRRLVDGHGAEKICRLVGNLEGADINVQEHLRKAAEKDCLPLWRLANDRTVRRNSFTQEFIPLEIHTRWFKEKMDSIESLLFVLDIEGHVAGQIRYEKERETASVHFSLGPAFRGRGIGRKMIEATIEKACRRLSARNIQGLVKKSNKASIASFLKAGFKKKSIMNKSGSECLVFEKACS